MNAIVEVETAVVAACVYESRFFVHKMTHAVSQFVSIFAIRSLEVLRYVVAPAPNTNFEGNYAAG